jgi:hypothetical protein
MASPKRTPAPIDPPVAKQRKCGGCGQTGHNRRTCPVVPAAAAPPVPAATVGGQNAVTEVGSPPPLVLTDVQDASSVDWDKVLLYVVFDLETTGRSRQRDEIIEVAAVVFTKRRIGGSRWSAKSMLRCKNAINTQNKNTK